MATHRTSDPSGRSRAQQGAAPARSKSRKGTKRRQARALHPRWIVAGALILIAGIVAILILTREDAAPRSTVGSLAPTPQDFSLPGVDGQPVALVDFRGQYVLVNFWASWCPPCKAEMPDLQAYHDAHRAQGFTVLAVNTNDDPVNAQEFLRVNRFTFPVAMDYTGVVFGQYGADALPSSYLIGPDGTLVRTWPAGALSRAILERDITPLLRG